VYPRIASEVYTMKDDDNTTSTKHKFENTMLENPLFLPPGSIRAVIGLILVIGTMWMWMNSPDSVPQGLAVLTASVVSFYYGTKK
jgi:hypothetical protein